MRLSFLCFSAALTLLCGKNMATETENVRTKSSESSAINTTSTFQTKTYTESVQNLNSETNDGNIPNNDFVENGTLLINVTLSEFDNSTDENENEAHDIHSSFNLAIIPALAVFVFIVLSCIKCCKWFRRYTRGGNKDDSYYAVIVTEEDRDYGQVDILSESASTACYDTVSSYTSFLKRSGNDSTLNSIRTLRQDGDKTDQSIASQSSNDVMDSTTPNMVKKYFRTDTDSRSFSFGSTKNKDEAEGSCDMRTSSTSSAETVSEMLTDSPAIRRNNRFRVSFVTENPGEISPNSENKLSNNGIRVLRSSLKRPKTTDIKACDSASQSSSINRESVKMVDIGTQTNKSFRYSLRKSKGHMSESDIDERFLSKLNTDLNPLQAEESKNLLKDVVKRNTDRQINAHIHVKHSSLSQEENSEPINSVCCSEMSKYPFDTNVEVIDNSNDTRDVVDDFEDDVFEKEVSDICKLDEEQKNRNNLTKPCSNANSKVQENSETSAHSCVNCCQEINRSVEHKFCDKSQTNSDENEALIDSFCAKCKLLQSSENNSEFEMDQKGIGQFIMRNKDRLSPVDLPEGNDRPPSSLSMESSGYAELSSTDSSSSTN